MAKKGKGSSSSSTGSGGNSRRESAPSNRKKAAKAPRKKAAPRSGSRKKGAREVEGIVMTPASLLLDHTTDDLLALQVLEEIEIGPGIEIASLDLKIRDGSAIVRGAVCDTAEVEALDLTIKEAGGIKNLVCQVQVSGTRVEEDRDHANRLQEVLEKEPDLEEEAISVACVGNRVILRGSVGSEALKAKAALLALRSGEATRISNRLVAMDHGSAGPDAP